MHLLLAYFPSTSGTSPTLTHKNQVLSLDTWVANNVAHHDQSISLGTAMMQYDSMGKMWVECCLPGRTYDLIWPRCIT
jgi:hypothetical protein